MTGASRWICTTDARLFRPALYSLSYRSEMVELQGVEPCGYCLQGRPRSRTTTPHDWCPTSGIEPCLTAL